MISVGWKDDSTRKDTWVNIDEREDFVVHIPPAEMAELVLGSSQALPFGVSETDHLKIKTAVVEGEKLPRLVGPKAALFCKKHKIIEVGEDRQGLILGEVKKLWMDDAAVKNQGEKILIDPQIINPLSRLGGNEYSLLGKVSSLRRSKPPI